jgi:two-component system, OmpR family, phosphate regulon sensor histidine kinase PhoR
LLTILDDLLLLSRLKENVGGARTETVSLSEMLEAALAVFKKEIEKRKLTVTLDRMDHPHISGSREYLQALWSYLLDNAIRYTRPGGRITLSLQENPLENKIIGTVTDTGIGIPSEEIPRIFEEFYRTKEAKSMQETGTGLGMCIVQEIVCLYGGTLEIDSTPELGSSFRFILPQTATLTGAS